MTKQHISFSELKTWAECPFKHKLQYIDKIKGFTGNVFTAFGTAIHSVCEHIAKDELDPIDYDEHFDLAFLYELKKLDDKPDNKMITQMRQQGKEISPSVFPQLKEHFMYPLRNSPTSGTSKALLILLLKRKTVNIIFLTGNRAAGAGKLKNVLKNW